MPRWTRTEQFAAVDEGWRIMFGKIVRNMARSELADDDQARDYVHLMAKKGSKLHAKAIEVEKSQSLKLFH